MGAGPGLLLVNPPPETAGSEAFVRGVPKIYVWAVFWFAVQVFAVTIAYLKVWRG